LTRQEFEVASATVNSRRRGQNPISVAVLEAAAATFGLLAATARLHIVWLLAQSERDVSSLADAVGATPQVVSQHLAKLRLAGLVQARREGRRQVYLICDPHVATVVEEMIIHLRGSTKRTVTQRAGR
jgi:DNA-binding transcriptional ArsR family regulator